MTTKRDRNPDVKISRQLTRQMDQFLAIAQKILVEKYGNDNAASICQETRIEFEKITPQIPDIGGPKNLLFQNLIQASFTLALHRALKRRGGTVEETGEIIHRGLEAMLRQMPAFLNTLNGRLYFSGFMRRKMQEAARRSQERKYPGDWIFEVVAGDDQTFHFGIDYTECAIVKFMNAQDAGELTPYLCNTDYVVSKAMGTGLRRTMTLAWGCEKCDFRYVKGGETLDGWPPRFVEKR